MGLLAKHAKDSGIETERKVTDDTLLALAMGCMAFADGGMDQSEIAMVEAFATTMPEFQDGCFAEPWNNSAAIFQKVDGDVFKAAQELAKLSTPALKKKAFILAVDLALASGDVDEVEDRLLDEMKKVLGVDDVFAQKVVEVLAMKYTS